MAYDPNDPARDPNAPADPVTRTERATASRSSPVGFIILAIAVVAAIAAFLMFRDDAGVSQIGMNNPPATQTTPNTPPAATPNNPASPGPTAPPAPNTPPAKSQ